MSSLILIIIPFKRAHAIPAFARKYKFSCNTCHAAVPKLKDYGDEFAGNGFLIPDGEEPKRAYIDTGDESLLLMRELPIAVRFDAYIQAAERDNAKTDLEVPYGLKLLSGGPITKSVSYYFYFYISERGEVAGVEDAIINFNDIANTSFDLAIGQFQVSDPLFKRELRLTFEDYQIYRIRPGLSEANLTYDRGIMASYGFAFGLDLGGMIVNGNGIKPAGEDRLFDIDSFKSYAFRPIQGIGPLNIGAFVYYGKEGPLETINNANNISIYGPDVSIGSDNFELNVQYLLREDDHARLVTQGGQKLESQGGFAEIIYLPKADQSKFIFSGLYNRIDSDDNTLDYETATFSVSHMAARNLRILAEFTYDLLNEKPKFTTGVMAAF
jgi:hypothetical protein